MSVYECRMPECHDEVYARGEVCESCWTHRLHELRRLPWLYVQVYAQLVPGSKPIDISFINVVSPEAGVPVNLTALDALQFAYDKCCAWTAYVANLYGLDYNTRGYTTGRAFAQAVEFLVEYDSRLATGFYAGDYVDDIHSVFRRLIRIAGPAVTRRIPNPCPHCDAMTVVERNAGETACCLTCGAKWAHSRIPNLWTQGAGATP